MVGEDEDRHVVGGVVAPPALPAPIPRAVAAAKHLPAHDVGADILEELVDHLRVDGALPTGLPLLLPPAGGREYPLVQAQPAFADGVLEALVGSRDEAIERDGNLAGDFAHTYIYIADACSRPGIRWIDGYQADTVSSR